MFREYNLQRLQSMHEDSTEEEEMNRQRKIKRKDGCENRWWVAELLAGDCEKAWLHPGKEETMQKWCVWLVKNDKGR